jgi:hypothetical protein
MTLCNLNVLRKIEELGLWVITAYCLVLLYGTFRRNLPEISERILDTTYSGAVGGVPVSCRKVLRPCSGWVIVRCCRDILLHF